MQPDHRMLNLQVPIALHEQLATRAKAEDLTVAQLVRRALRAHLANPPEGHP